MTLDEAIAFIKPGISETSRIWADIGAGTGMFTQALAHILLQGNEDGDTAPYRIYAVDKNPHALWTVQAGSEIEIAIVEADFHEPLDLPPLDGIVMANALHYAKDHQRVLSNVLRPLKSGGTFILIEYDTEMPVSPWVPNPVSFRMFETLCSTVGLSDPELLGSMMSRYGYDRIYAARCDLI